MEYGDHKRGKIESLHKLLQLVRVTTPEKRCKSTSEIKGRGFPFPVPTFHAFFMLSFYFAWGPATTALSVCSFMKQFKLQFPFKRNTWSQAYLISPTLCLCHYTIGFYGSLVMDQSSATVASIRVSVRRICRLFRWVDWPKIVKSWPLQAECWSWRHTNRFGHFFAFGEAEAVTN